MRGFFLVVGALLLVALSLRLGGFTKVAPAPPEATAGQALVTIATSARELDLRPLWDNLPPSWKTTADGLVAKLEASANPELWALGFDLIERTASLAATPAGEARGLLGSRRLADLLGLDAGAAEQVPGEAIEHARARLAAALRTVATSGLDDADNLSYLDLREQAGVFLPAVERQLQALDGHAGEPLMSAAWSASLAAAAQAASAAPPDQTRFTLELPAGLSHGPFEETVELVQLEGCWVPTQLSAALPAKLAELDAELDNWTAAPDSPKATYARSLLEAGARGLDQLEAARDDPARFDDALDGLVGELTGLVVGHKLRGLFE